MDPYDNLSPSSRLHQLLSDDKVKLAAGVLAAAIVLVFAFWRPAPAQQGPTFGSVDEALEDSAPSESERSDSASGSKAATKAERLRRAAGERPVPKPAQSAPTPAAPAPTPAAVPKAKEAPVAKPPREEAIEPRADKQPSPADKPARTAPQPTPPPAPSLTSTRVRALPAGASIESVTAALGGPVAAPEALKTREPPGRDCRYWKLAPGEPAPMVRLCFDVKGHLQAREYIAP